MVHGRVRSDRRIFKFDHPRSRKTYDMEAYDKRKRDGHKNDRTFDLV